MIQPARSVVCLPPSRRGAAERRVERVGRSGEDFAADDRWLAMLYEVCSRDSLREPSRLIVRKFDELASSRALTRFERLLGQVDVGRLNAAALASLLASLHMLSRWSGDVASCERRIRDRLRELGRNDILAELPEGDVR